ncbi:flagellar hook-basal body complex protein FliE [Litchfieldia salsa]|uniref:Flagellar hook-basal body complex protein FliE n=1 Tax=Litchfieldia salsa TaxID=930152 RepID=A0A1H0R7S1_9BACI|nr:flagellar hook-basal body complex protein FliE [Litchfieldia salsa]SDP25544.1 flagellar hook-basal body complex protein FliE [Litchfieldia salsa]
MIDRINVANQFKITNQTNPINKPTASQSTQAFSTFLKDAINEVNRASNESDAMTGKLIKGEKVDLHEVMISAEKSGVTLLTTIEIRNKVVEAYQEVMRMQV